MDDAITYLYNRITEAAEIKAQAPRANISAGCQVILDIYGDQFPTRDDMDIFFDIAYGHIQKKTKPESKSLPRGKGMLTSVSTSIGSGIRRACQDTQLEDQRDNWKRSISLGDLVLESLYLTDYIDIQHEWLTSETTGKRYKAYTVILSKRWQYEHKDPFRLIGTTFDYINPITKLEQGHGRSVIKQWHPSDAKLFQSYLDRPFITALDNIQRQGWKLNTPVVETLIANQDKFLKIDDSTPLKELQSISRASEFRSIMALALRFIYEDEFYQYAECDYRGRVYFSEPFLNFQGSDVARGIMLYNKPKRVTEKGLRWLARHTATCFNETFDKSHPFAANYRNHLAAESLDDISVDKMTLEDRERWTWDNMEMICSTWGLDSGAEKSVSFLACAYEWRKYHENKEHFFSALPIPIDGSNNGWQHLAAISADADAGRLVGLVPTRIQEDFYVKTAKALMKFAPDWFEERNIPMKDIRKGISKRGSMTRAYSAGAQKIADNMYLDCRAAKYTDLYDITEGTTLMLANNLIKAIETVCPGPLKTMKYLQELAMHHVETNRDSTMFWETPSGFPVVYDAPRMNKFKYRIRMRKPGGGDNRINHVGRFPCDFPDVQKLMSGISPNFIHSLDATHMCLVLSQWNGAFGGVHDSFSTHADDVDELLALTKAVFMDMYDSGSNFKDIKRILQLEDAPVTEPNLGSLKITEVKDSDYFFA